MIDFYLKTDDVCDELGISPRQLAYWEQNGLFSVKRHGKYTESEIAQIARVRDLVVGWKLPVDFVKRLVDEPEATLQVLVNLVSD